MGIEPTTLRLQDSRLYRMRHTDVVIQVVLSQYELHGVHDVTEGCVVQEHVVHGKY